MSIGPSTIDMIRKALAKQGIRNRYIQSELCDHIACDMEHMMDQGIGEEEAWNQAFAKNRGEEIRTTARQFQGILNSRYYRVKLVLWATFGMFAVSWLFSFRTGQFMSAVSFMAMGATLILLSLDFFRSRRHHPSNIWLGAGSLLSALLVMSGFILFFLVVNYGVNTHGHSVDLMIFSYVLFSLVAFFYFSRQRRLAVESSSTRSYNWFVIFSAVQLFLAILSFLSLPLYAWAVDYIWILIWVILAVDLLSLALLILLRIRNMIFFVLLALSFMITFIHSPVRRLLPAGEPPRPTQVAADNRIDYHAPRLLSFHQTVFP